MLYRGPFCPCLITHAHLYSSMYSLTPINQRHCAYLIRQGQKGPLCSVRFLFQYCFFSSHVSFYLYISIVVILCCDRDDQLGVMTQLSLIVSIDLYRCNHGEETPVEGVRLLTSKGVLHKLVVTIALQWICQIFTFSATFASEGKAGIN